MIMSQRICKIITCTSKTSFHNGLCRKHGGGLCITKGCYNKSPYHNSLCKSHGGANNCCYPNCKSLIKKTTINLCKLHGNGKACIMPNCYKLSDPTTHLCPEHSNTPKCKTAGCHSPPISYPPESKSLYCAFHSQKSRCPNCVDWIDSQKGQEKYDGYCIRCFKHCFPNDPRINTIKADTKEFKVQHFINQHFEGFIHNVPIYSHNCDCTCRRRIDHYLPLGGSILVVETDEYQHRYYSKMEEDVRYNDLYMHFSGKWIFIRFNVHSYTDNTGHYRLTKLPARLEVLRHEIDKQIKRINNDENTDLLEIVPLFYDGYDYQPPVREVTNEIIPPPSNT